MLYMQTKNTIAFFRVVNLLSSDKQVVTEGSQRSGGGICWCVVSNPVALSGYVADFYISGHPAPFEDISDTVKTIAFESRVQEYFAATARAPQPPVLSEEGVTVVCVSLSNKS